MMNEFIQFLINHWALWVAFVLLLGMLAMLEGQGKVRGVQKVSPQDAIDLINRQHAVVVDVRTEEEFAKQHINNAKNIPLSELENQINQLMKYKQKPIILTCNTGQRTIIAGVKLKKHGFESVYSLHGGLKAWLALNLPLVKA